MDAAMLAGWNERVGPDDEVWHLGDFALRMPTAEMETLLGALNGRKHLVIGNNDGAETVRLRGWATVTPYAEIEVEGTRLVLCHYPFRSWNGMHQGVLDLHGPRHGRHQGLPRQTDVGLHGWNFTTVTLDAMRPRRRA